MLILDGRTRDYLKVFSVYKELQKSKSAFKSLKKNEEIHDKIENKQFTVDDAKMVLKEWLNLNNKRAVFPDNNEAIIRIQTKLEALISGQPVTKTYIEWTTIINNISFSKIGKKEIADTLTDFLEDEKNMTQTFGKLYAQFDFKTKEVTVYLPKEDAKKIV